MRRRLFLGSALSLAIGAAHSVRGEDGNGDSSVDLLLVLAADVSSSMDRDELRLQREGYAGALAHPAVLEAIRGGPYGAIAVAYFEWSGVSQERLLLPWMRIASEGDAGEAAQTVLRAPVTSGTWTSVASALRFSRRLLSEAPFISDRKVIDVSGDGEDNSGLPVAEERDRAVAEGITVNGLPILQPRPGNPGPALDDYYRERVAGGFGAFVLPAENFDTFGVAVRRKLVMEIAGRPLAPYALA